MSKVGGVALLALLHVLLEEHMMARAVRRPAPQLKTGAATNRQHHQDLLAAVRAARAEQLALGQRRRGVRA